MKLLLFLFAATQLTLAIVNAFPESADQFKRQTNQGTTSAESTATADINNATRSSSPGSKSNHLPLWTWALVAGVALILVSIAIACAIIITTNRKTGKKGKKEDQMTQEMNHLAQQLAIKSKEPKRMSFEQPKESLSREDEDEVTVDVTGMSDLDSNQNSMTSLSAAQGRDSPSPPAKAMRATSALPLMPITTPYKKKHSTTEDDSETEVDVTGVSSDDDSNATEEINVDDTESEDELRPKVFKVSPPSLDGMLKQIQK